MGGRDPWRLTPIVYFAMLERIPRVEQFFSQGGVVTDQEQLERTLAD
jgi:hypothetical protein